MNFLIYPNLKYADTVVYAQKLIQFLEKNGHKAFLPDGAALQSVDMCIVVGGDGTVLHAIRQYYNCGFPFWSINGGHLGYLTECQPEEAQGFLRKIMAGEYRLEKRIMMQGYHCSGDERQDFFALNEAVIHRAAYMRALHLQVAVSGVGLLRFGGDGMLVSTPTGSTAYNLAAGGPILLPVARQMVITPICPHAALCPPIVVSAKETINIRLDPARTDDVQDRPSLVIDGCLRRSMKPGDLVECTVAPWEIGFVRTSDDSFYRKLQQRMAAND